MADYLDPTPMRRPFFGGLAKLAGGLDSYARDPNNLLAQILPVPNNSGVGITSGFASLMGLPEAKTLLEKLAYGEKLTKGKGETFGLQPDVLEGAATLLPLAGGMAKGAYKAAGKVSLSPKGQVNALYPGGNPELFLSHGTTPSQLATYNAKTGETGLPAELYNLSLAVNRNSLSNFGGADLALIPQLGRFDPKLEKTILTATDSYSPRYSGGAGSRVDEFRRDFGKLFGKPELYKQVASRLSDQFGSPFPQGGIYGEGNKNTFRSLRGFAKGTDYPFEGRDALPYTVNTEFANRVHLSPRFQSFKHYEDSPYGGKLLGSQSGHSALNAVERARGELLDNLFLDTGFGAPDPLGGYNNWAKTLRTLSSGLANPFTRSDRGRKFDNLDRGEFDFSKLRLRSPGDSWDSPDNFRPLTDEEIYAIRGTSNEILKKMKTAPSNYAELKSYGATKLNPSTFAGIVAKAEPGTYPAMEKAAKQRGLAFEYANYSDADATQIADEMQRAGKNPSILTRGLAWSGRNPEPPADYKTLTKAVSDANKALQQNPDDGDVQAAFTKAAKAWQAQSDSFHSSGKISQGEHGAMNEFINKNLKAIAANPPDIPSKKVDFGLPSAKKPAGPFGDAWLDHSFTKKNFETKSFDYIGDEHIAQLKDYAAKTGNDPLKDAIANYEEHSLTMGNSLLDSEIHDDMVKEILNHTDAIKSGWQAPTPKKDWSTASWEELNGLSQEAVEAMPMTEWNQWNNAWDAANKAKSAKQPDAFGNIFGGLAKQEVKSFEKNTLADLKKMDTSKFGHEDMLAWQQAGNAWDDKHKKLLADITALDQINPTDFYIHGINNSESNPIWSKMVLYQTAKKLADENPSIENFKHWVTETADSLTQLLKDQGGF